LFISGFFGVLLELDDKAAGVDIALAGEAVVVRGCRAL